jgi:voltage-gated potassium channel
LYEVIFRADTTSGKSFDIVLIIIIIMSVFTVIINTVDTVEHEYGSLLYKVEWCFYHTLYHRIYFTIDLL